MMKPRDFFLNKTYMENAVVEDHELRGITPEMVDWWWDHIDNSERYLMWHPKDHISFKWLVPPTQSHIGAIQLVEEYIGGQRVTIRIRWEDPRDVPAEYSHVRGSALWYPDAVDLSSPAGRPQVARTGLAYS
jgi:hypothetical protein